MVVTNSMVKRVYKYAKEVYKHNLTLTDAKIKMVDEYNMNPGTAQDYIKCFEYMMCGNKYTRTINVYATNYYFENILNDFGNKALEMAIMSTEKHVEYYEEIRKVRLNKIRELITKYKAKV